jgi:hypothetical protein
MAPPGDWKDVKAALVKRLHDAMLTMRFAVRRDDLGRYGNGWPNYVQEFSDRVGEEADTDAPRPRFRASAAQVTDMLPALALLEGLRPEYFHVVYLKAWGDFIDRITWQEIGDEYGKSASWAKEVYERALIQAARKGGLAPAASQDHAVFCSAVIIDGLFLTYIGASPNPRQQLSDHRSKNALEIVDAFAIWTAGKPVATRIADAVKAELAGKRLKGSWFAVNPFDVESAVISAAQTINATWRAERLIEVVEEAMGATKDRLRALTDAMEA